jgi:hypothetical protein
MKRANGMEANEPPLILRRANASRAGDPWDDDDYDVLCDGRAIGRIFASDADASPYVHWHWSIFYHERELDMMTFAGREASCELAMAALASSWRRPWSAAERGPGL